MDFGPALAGLGQAVEQQRQRKLQQALQQLQLMKSLYGQIPPQMWQGIAPQIERASKALGTPFQLPQQPQMGPAQTQVTPPTNPAFGAGTAQIPPQPTGQTEYAPPRQPIGEMTVASFVKDPQRLAELAKQFPGIEQATLDEANQQYPEWRYSYRAGTSQGGQGQTFGDLEPWLKENPKLAQIASIPITYDLIDQKTGMADRKKIRDQITFDMGRQGLQPPTQHETNVEQQQKVNAFQAAVRAAESRIGQFEQDILHGKPGQIHAAVAARDQYLNTEQQRLKRAADALRAQGVPVDFTQLPYTRYTPEQLAGITKPARDQEARQEARDARSEALLRLSERRTQLAEDRAAGKDPKFSDPETIDGHQLRFVSKPDGSVKPQEYIGKHWVDIPDARFEAITGSATTDITRRRVLERRIAALREAMTKKGANKTALRKQLQMAESELGTLVPGSVGGSGPRAPGLLIPGTIDPMNRPKVHNPDGTYSTLRTITFSENGRTILIPTVVNGKVVSPKQAIDHYHQTGEHLGIFDTQQNADAYDRDLHNRIEPGSYDRGQHSPNGAAQPGRPTGTPTPGAQPRKQADPTPAALQAFGIWGQTGRQKIPDDIWGGFDQNTKDYMVQHGYTPQQYGQGP